MEKWDFVEKLRFWWENEVFMGLWLEIEGSWGVWWKIEVLVEKWRGLVGK